MLRLRRCRLPTSVSTLLKPTSQPAVYYGWFIVATTFFISMVSVGTRNGFGAFVVPMETEFGWDRSTISWAVSIGFLVNGLSQPFLGRLFDTYGVKVIAVGLAILGISTIMLFTTFHIIFLVFVFGIVMSMATSGASLQNMGALVARWFQRKRATALGLSTSGACAGGLLLVPFIVYLIQVTNWRVAWIVVGGLVLAIGLPLALLVLKNDPKDMGLSPDGDKLPVERDQNGAARTNKGPLEVDNWISSLRTRPIWLITGAYFVCGFTTSLWSVHFIPYAQDRGLSASTAAIAFGLMSGVNCVGIMVMATLSDRFGRKNLLTLVYVLRGCAYAVLLLSAPSPWGLWAFVLMAGFSWIATAPLTTALTADVYGLRALGTLAGVSFLVHQVGAFSSIQFAGYMYDATGEYTIPFTICGFLLIPAAISAFSVQEKKYSAKYRTAPSTTASFGD